MLSQYLSDKRYHRKEEQEEEEQVMTSNEANEAKTTPANPVPSSIITRPKPPVLFIFFSKMGGGKDFMRNLTFNTARNECDRSPLGVAFADPFKIECVSKHGVDYDKVFGDKRDVETRELLQRLGMEGIKEFGPGCWCNMLETRINLDHERGINVFVGSDGRFLHEGHWGKKLRAEGKFNVHLIRLVAPKRSWARAMKEANNDEKVASRIASHASEVSLDNKEKWEGIFDLVIDNDPEHAVQAVETITNYVKGALTPRDADASLEPS